MGEGLRWQGRRKFDYIWKEFVNSFPVVVGILWVLRFPAIEKVDKVGYLGQLIKTWLKMVWTV